MAAIGQHLEAVPHRRGLWSYNQQWTLLIVVLIVVDALAIYGSLSLAYVARLSSGLLAYHAAYDPAAYQASALLSIPIWLILFAALGLYRRDLLLGGLAEYQEIVRACSFGIVTLVTLSYFWHESPVLSRGWLLLAWGFACVGVGVGRFGVRRVAHRLRRRGFLTARVLIVGANDQGIAMAHQWLRSPASGMAVIGFLDDFKPVGTTVVDGLQVLGRPTGLDELARQGDVQEVVVVSGAVAWESFEEILARPSLRNGYVVRLSPGFYQTLATGVVVTNKSFVPLLTVNAARLTGVDALLKRGLDCGIGFLLLLVTLPLFGLIVVGLKLTTPHEPVIDRYRTVGRCGVPFTMFKFHTRRSHPGHLSRSGTRENGQASPADGPLSPLAAILLRSGLDKLPQLINVLAGQMGLVGPRPRMSDDDGTSWHKAQNLQTVKPGVIGPWATSGYAYAAGESHEELFYVRNWTIWLDLQILYQTLVPWLHRGRQRQPVVSALPITAPSDNHPDACDPSIESLAVSG